MVKNFFKVIRGGVLTTFQDQGYFNVQHLGITTGGVADNNLFRLANKILNNELNMPVLEFAHQGPLLKLKKGKCRIVITGNVKFNILHRGNIIKGIPNQSYLLNEGDLLDVLATIKSNYGYIAVEGGFKVSKHYGCSSTLVQSTLGPNNGKKILDKQLLFFYQNGSRIKSSLVNYSFTSNDNVIKVLRGPQMNYFMQKVIKNFFSKSFTISNKTNRMGVRIEGNTISSIKSHNIASEGIVKGSIQVPGSGDPIILMTEHPTIGGYPKIATVILADITKVAQLPIGTKINFQEVSLLEAEQTYREKNDFFESLLNTIQYN